MSTISFLLWITATEEAVRDIYLAEESPTYQDLLLEIDIRIFESLRKTLKLKVVSLDGAQSHLLRTLLQNKLQSFIKTQISEMYKVKLGERIYPNDWDGLGNCYYDEKEASLSRFIHHA